MFRTTKGTVMIMSQEQALLKAYEQFHHLLDSVRQAADQAQRTDLVERDIMLRLLGIGLTVLTSFIARHGDGDSGPTVGTPDGRTLRRLPEPHGRRYVSIFGELGGSCGTAVGAGDLSPRTPGSMTSSEGSGAG